MGPGHSGAALAAKPLAPRVPLWILFAVSEGIDVLFLIFAFVGIERQSVTRTSLENGIEMLTPGVILWSHGFFMSLIWSGFAALITYTIMRKTKPAFVVGLVFFSR